MGMRARGYDPPSASGPVDISAAWPVGSVFISTVTDSPSVLMGFGTWESLGAGRMIVGFDDQDPDFDAPKKTGGAKFIVPAGQVSQPDFTGSVVTTTGQSAGTPSGTLSTPTFAGVTATFVHAGAAVLSHTYTPQGTVSAHGSIGSKQGTAAGTVVTTSAHIFVGVATTLSHSITQPNPHTYAPAGTISQQTFTGVALATHSHTVSIAGSVSAPSFSGDTVTVMNPYIVCFLWERTA